MNRSPLHSSRSMQFPSLTAPRVSLHNPTWCLGPSYHNTHSPSPNPYAVRLSPRHLTRQYQLPSPQPTQHRSITISPLMSSRQIQKKDWSATQYLKFNNERTRAVYDLVSQILPHISAPKPRIYDLGCGPGNSTKVLHDAFPNAVITGMDSSPVMLEKARGSLPDLDFIQGGLESFKTDEPADLLFSNAVFHWLRQPARIPTLVRLFEGLGQGGVVATQVPDNYHEPSHSLMRDTAGMSDAPWSQYFDGTSIGDVEDHARPDLDPIETPGAYYNALIPYAASVNIWRTNYQHVLRDASAIVEWVKGTGLQPYLNMIEVEGAKKSFLEEYERRLKELYPELVDGRVLLAYPRLFVVAVRK